MQWDAAQARCTAQLGRLEDRKLKVSVLVGFHFLCSSVVETFWQVLISLLLLYCLFVCFFVCFFLLKADEKASQTEAEQQEKRRVARAERRQEKKADKQKPQMHIKPDTPVKLPQKRKVSSLV